MGRKQKVSIFGFEDHDPFSPRIEISDGPQRSTLIFHPKETEKLFLLFLLSTKRMSKYAKKKLETVLGLSIEKTRTKGGGKKTSLRFYPKLSQAYMEEFVILEKSGSKGASKNQGSGPMASLGMTGFGRSPISIGISRKPTLPARLTPKVKKDLDSMIGPSFSMMEINLTKDLEQDFIFWCLGAQMFLLKSIDVVREEHMLRPGVRFRDEEFAMETHNKTEKKRLIKIMMGIWEQAMFNDSNVVKL